MPGEATSAGIGASVQRIEIPAFGVSLGLMGALHTSRPGFAGLQEALNEDVLGYPLLLDVDTQADGSLTPRTRPGGENLYSPEQGQYVPQAERPSAYFAAPSLAARSAADIGFGVEASDTLELGAMHCGGGVEMALDNSVQTFTPGSSWQVGSLFTTSASLLDGPRMPALPNPEGAHLTAGRILVVPGQTLKLQAPNRSLDPLAQDIVLLMGAGFGRVNRPDCGENICDDQIDNDGDGKVDCRDADCEGQAGLEGTCPESTCWDGIDNDNNGFADCADQESDCSDSDCLGADQGTIIAFPVSDDGSVEMNWDDFPLPVTNGAAPSGEDTLSFMLAWGRTSSRIALDTENGVESALLSSTQWLIYELLVLPEGHHVVGIDRQLREELPGRVFSMDFTPADDKHLWSDDRAYQVAVLDRYDRVAIGEQEGSQGHWITSENKELDGVGVDVSALCRGVAIVLVADCDMVGGANASECPSIGVGTFDYRHPQLHCDNMFPSTEHAGAMSPGQVTCSSFSERPQGADDPVVHRYYFDAVAGASYQIEALSAQLSMDNKSDIDIVLLNDDGELQEPLGVVSGQDYCGGDPRMVWHCTQSGQYELKVQKGAGEDFNAPYKLLIEPL